MSGVSNKWKKEGNCQFIDYLNVYKNLRINTNLLPFATVKTQKQNVVKKGDLLLTSASEKIEECVLSSVVEDDIKENTFMDDHLFGLRLKNEYIYKVNTSFINYYMHTKEFRKVVIKAVRGVTRYYISKEAFSKIKIPLPPLEVQKEIVRILDNFTFLTAELTEELEARKKQYEYYRDELLSFKNNEGGIIYKTLIELGKFYNGLFGKNKLDFVNGNKKFITYKNVFNNIEIDISTYEKVRIETNEKQNKIEFGDVVFTGSSENIDECAMSSVLTKEMNDDIYLNSFSFIFRLNEKDIILPGFSKYLFRSYKLRKQLIKTAAGVTRYNVSKKKMEKVIIPIPPLEIQQKIVKILDKFDELCNDICEGLPAEIEARKKQYEYYRDKLLTFKKIK